MLHQWHYSNFSSIGGTETIHWGTRKDILEMMVYEKWVKIER